MARYQDNTNSNNNINNNTVEREKAEGFLNISIQDDAGDIQQFAKTGIPLYRSNQIHELFIDGLLSAETSTEALAALLGSLVITFQSAVPKNRKAGGFSFAVKPAVKKAA